MGEDGLQVGLAERPPDPLGRSSSSSKGQDRELAIEGSSLLLAGGSLGTWPSPPLLRSVLVGALGGWLDVGDAVGGALLGLDAFDGRADSLPVLVEDWRIGYNTVRPQDALG